MVDGGSSLAWAEDAIQAGQAFANDQRRTTIDPSSQNEETAKDEASAVRL